MAQHANIHMGNDDPTNLIGFIELLRCLPRHPRAARWYNTVLTYGEQYVKTTASLNPFKIYPISAYHDPQYGGIKFFQNIIHGAICLYGQIARNLLELGKFLNDRSYQELAHQNVQYVAGLNPGVPDAFEESAWDAQSLIIGVGSKWFNHSHTVSKIPKGSVINMFSASPQFWHPRWESWIEDYPDGPRGIFLPDGTYSFNEDWIAHSHSYVSGVSHLEASFVLEVRTFNDGKPVLAEIIVNFEENVGVLSESTGTYTARLPSNKSGTIIAKWNGQRLEKRVETIGGGSFAWELDFANYIEIQLSIPKFIPKNTVVSAILLVTNFGNENCKAQIDISAAGLQVLTIIKEITLESNETCEFPLELVAENYTMPFLLYTFAQSGKNSVIAIANGKIG